ncbi:hypothetical protein GGR50DRAFT_361596 [Xylaria sp. CBS 124048]|nr:hypothetical protein GGR50DRAFT_361596 [Xylaria sp. CBS 124048]
MPISHVTEGAQISAHVSDNGHLIYVPAWIFVFLCPFAVGMRIWSRRRTRAYLGADDYTILASLAFAIVTDIILLYGCSYGYGRHAASLTPHQRYEAFKAFYLTQVTYKTSINLTKSSILLLYLRIFGGVKWFRWTCFCLLALVGSYCVAAIVTTIFQCIPVAAAFDKTIADRTCINNEHFWFANAGFSIATDVVILTIPMPLVYALQIPRVQKIAVIFVFTLGAFVVITSCLRATTLDVQAKSHDPLYDVASTMWTIIEMSVAIVCACLPQIRPLIVKLLPPILVRYCDLTKRGSRPGSGHLMTFGSSLVKSYGSGSRRHPQNYDDNDNDNEEEEVVVVVDNWHGIEVRDGVHVSRVEKGDGEGGRLETYPESEHSQSTTGIQKTMQYSVEYSS